MAAVLQLKTSITVCTVSLLGIGLSLIFDVFVASLYVPQLEPDSTKIYIQHLKPTLIIFAAITAIALLLWVV